MKAIGLRQLENSSHWYNYDSKVGWFIDSFPLLFEEGTTIDKIRDWYKDIAPIYDDVICVDLEISEING